MSEVKRADVLLVEPDRILADTYVKALEHAGLAARTCSSAEEAISIVDTYKPKLIVLELQLPGHNGIEFLNELGSYPDLKNISIILLTFVPEADIHLTRSNFKIARYLYKPQATLEQMIESVKDAVAV